MVAELRSRIRFGDSLESVPQYFARPVRLVKTYDRANSGQIWLPGLQSRLFYYPRP